MRVASRLRAWREGRAVHVKAIGFIFWPIVVSASTIDMPLFGRLTAAPIGASEQWDALEESGLVLRLEITVHRPRGGSFGISLNDANVVTNCSDDSALQRSDAIIEVDGTDISNSKLERHVPAEGESMVLTILRPQAKLSTLQSALRWKVPRFSSVSSASPSTPRTKSLEKSDVGMNAAPLMEVKQSSQPHGSPDPVRTSTRTPAPAA